MTAIANIILLYLAGITLLIGVWLVKHRNALQEAAQRWWRGMNDKEAYWPAFITALLIWLFILWIRGDI